VHFGEGRDREFGSNLGVRWDWARIMSVAIENLAQSQVEQLVMYRIPFLRALLDSQSEDTSAVLFDHRSGFQQDCA
jgi:hypothetical protein